MKKLLSDLLAAVGTAVLAAAFMAVPVAVLALCARAVLWALGVV